MEKKYIIATYGSLRVGQYNYDAFKSWAESIGKDFLYIETITLKGYNLYSLGAYPAVIESEFDTDTLTVDLMLCSEEVYRRITNMELNAGYLVKDISDEINKVFVHPVMIYLYEDENWLANSTKQVESGDWVKHLNEN